MAKLITANAQAKLANVLHTPDRGEHAHAALDIAFARWFEDFPDGKMNDEGLMAKSINIASSTIRMPCNQPFSDILCEFDLSHVPFMRGHAAASLTAIFIESENVDEASYRAQICIEALYKCSAAISLLGPLIKLRSEVFFFGICKLACEVGYPLIYVGQGLCQP